MRSRGQLSKLANSHSWALCQHLIGRTGPGCGEGGSGRNSRGFKGISSIVSDSKQPKQVLVAVVRCARKRFTVTELKHGT